MFNSERLDSNNLKSVYTVFVDQYIIFHVKTNFTSQNPKNCTVLQDFSLLESLVLMI